MTTRPGSARATVLARLAAAALLAAAVAGWPGAATGQAVRGPRATTTGGTSIPVGHASILAGNDDGSTAAVSIGFTLNFFGATYDQLHVNNNGNVTFGRGMDTFTPFALSTGSTLPIIAPFFADVDTRRVAVRDFGGYTPPAVGYASFASYGAGSAFSSLFGNRNVFSVTWSDVGYYREHTNLTNTFQLNLIEREDTGAGLGNFDIEFDYDQVQWETGDASQGSGGFGGFSARAGFSRGTGVPGTFSELSGSGVHGALVDGGASSLVAGSFGSGGVAGRYLFEVRNGGTGEPGTTQGNPLQPTLIDPGDPAQGIVPVYQFNNARSGAWYDPPDTWGYQYDALGGTLFTGLGLPTGFANPFDVWYGAGFGTRLGAFAGGSAVDFVALLGNGLDAFRITGISPRVDSADPFGFPTQLFFENPTGNSFTMTPLVAAVPEPSTWLLLAAGLAVLLLLSALGKRRHG